MNYAVYQNIPLVNVRPVLLLPNLFLTSRSMKARKSLSEWLKENKVKPLGWSNQGPELNLIGKLWHGLEKVVLPPTPPPDPHDAELQEFIHSCHKQVWFKSPFSQSFQESHIYL